MAKRKKANAIAFGKWYPFEKLDSGFGEVLAFHPNWIDKDYNPNGTRVGFLADSGTFISAEWNEELSTYRNSGKELPTHFQRWPKKPRQARSEQQQGTDPY